MDDLNDQEQAVLRVLATRGPMTAPDVADAIGLTGPRTERKAKATRLLKRLVGKSVVAVGRAADGTYCLPIRPTAPPPSGAVPPARPTTSGHKARIRLGRAELSALGYLSTRATEVDSAEVGRVLGKAGKAAGELRRLTRLGLVRQDGGRFEVAESATLRDGRSYVLGVLVPPQGDLEASGILLAATACASSGEGDDGRYDSHYGRGAWKRSLFKAALAAAARKGVRDARAQAVPDAVQEVPGGPGPRPGPPAATLEERLDALVAEASSVLDAAMSANRDRVGRALCMGVGWDAITGTFAASGLGADAAALREAYARAGGRPD